MAGNLNQSHETPAFVAVDERATLSEQSLSEIVLGLWRYRYVLILSGVVGFGLGFVLNALRPPAYEVRLRFLADVDSTRQAHVDSLIRSGWFVSLLDRNLGVGQSVRYEFDGPNIRAICITADDERRLALAVSAAPKVLADAREVALHETHEAARTVLEKLQAVDTVRLAVVEDALNTEREWLAPSSAQALLVGPSQANTEVQLAAARLRLQFIDEAVRLRSQIAGRKKELELVSAAPPIQWLDKEMPRPISVRQSWARDGVLVMVLALLGALSVGAVTSIASSLSARTVAHPK